MGFMGSCLLRLVAAATAVGITACASQPSPPPSAIPTVEQRVQPAEPPPTPPAPPAPPQPPSEPIQTVDFANFTFPWPSRQTPHVGERTFRLENGTRPGALGPDGQPRLWSAFLNEVELADLTADGKAEAIVGLYLLPDARSTVHGYYVYTLKGRRPHLLWSFIAKDRGEGALRRVYNENGEVVVELLGADQEIAPTVPPNFDRAPTQPAQFTRLRFRWDGDEFSLVSRENHPNPVSPANRS